MKIRLADPELQKDSIVDGDGLRAVLWTQGCSHNCKGCHNPQTHAFDEGFMVDVEVIKSQIDQLELQDGLTFSGGDPMFQARACAEIASYAKSKGLNVWCYTGFTFEQLLQLRKTNVAIEEFLRKIDVLVDGKFVLEQKSYDCLYRGSTNQRILDVRKSLDCCKAVCITKYDQTIKEKPQFSRRRVFV